MSNSLSILQVGVVGVNPRILFLETFSPENVVFAPGFINSIEAGTNIVVQKGDFIFIKYDEGSKQEIAIPEIGPNNVITLLPIAGDLNTGGPINGGQNLGAGVGVFASVDASLMEFKSLLAGNNVTLSSTGTDITINAADPGVGTITDGVNLGSGNGVFSMASGTDLQFKSLVAGANISITPTANQLTIAGVGAGGGTITDGLNIGTGTGVFESASGSDLQFKTLKSGTNVTLTSDADSITISSTGGGGGGGVTGAANLGSGTGVFASLSGSTLDFKSLVAGPNVSISNTSTAITITSTGGSGSFTYEKAYWVAKNGDNLNDGLSIDRPKLTIQNTLAAITADAPTALTVINIVDSGLYSGNFTFPTSCNILLNAPGATFTSLGNGLFNTNNGIVVVNVGNILVSSLNLLQCTNSLVFINAVSISGIINNNVAGNTRLFVNVDSYITGDVLITSTGDTSLKFYTLIGNITDTSPSLTANVSLNGTTIFGNLSSSNTRITGNVTSVTGTVSGVSRGFFNSIYYDEATFKDISTHEMGTENNYSPVRHETYDIGRLINSNETVLKTDGNTIILIDQQPPQIDITLPSYATEPDLPLGFRVFASHNQASGGGAAGGAHWLAESPDVLNQSEGSYTLPGISQAVLIQQDVNFPFERVWTLTGDLRQNNIYSGPNFYISQVNGDDLTGDGSPELQFATINAALAYVITNFTASPVNVSNLVVTDDATYTEQVDLSATQKINLIASTATIVHSGAGFTITTSDSFPCIINVASIVGSAGASAISVPLTGVALISCLALQGDVENSSNGDCFINASTLNGDITNTGGGSTYYATASRNGTDAAQTFGISPSGTSSDFTVGGILNVSGAYQLPNVDGTIGQVMTTNGVGFAAWGTPSFVPFTPVAGVSAGASPNSGYINDNVALTTITLPNIAAEGSVVAIQGKGAGGWVLEAFAGQTIHYFSVDTTVGGSLASTGQYDTVQVVCLVADTEWSVTYSGGAGLTVS